MDTKNWKAVNSLEVVLHQSLGENNPSQVDSDRLGGVMGCVIAWSAEDRGSDPRPGETKDIKIGICCFTLSAQHLGVRAKTGQPGVRIVCLGKWHVFLQTVAFVS